MTKLLLRWFVKDYKNVQDPAVRRRYGTMGGVVGILCNVLLCAAKMVAGILTGSVSVMADAFNNLSDAGSSVVTLAGFKMSGRPADDEHPFGHGRMEYISGFVVSMVIILVGVELVRSSVEKIITPEPVEFGVVPLVILLLSIAVKLWMCLFNRKLGAAIQSSAMKATAMDSLSDVAATTAVVVGILVGHFAQVAIDGYVGVLVALFILYTGYNTAKETMNLLLGEAPDAEFVRQIEKRVLSYPEIMGVHDLIVHNYGPGHTVVSLHAEVPCHVDILKIHDTIDNIERKLHEEFGCEAVIHMDPIVTDDQKINEVHAKVASLVKLIDPVITVHDFRMVTGPTHTNLIFDVVVPHRFRLTDEEVKQAVNLGVKTLDSTYEAVINVDKAYIGG